jgi:hypothetical protein
MSDELPETADKAIRLWLAAIGFTLVLVGGDMMAEKDGARFGLGMALAIIALPVHLGWVFWQKVKPKLNAGILKELGTVAVSPRWWFGTLLVLLAALIFMPVIQAPRWPSLPFSRTELTSIPTKLRLQFNAKNAFPEEIEKQNLSWTAVNYTETRKEEPSQKYVCDPHTTGTITLQSPLSLGGVPNCSYLDFPNYAEVPNWVIFLTFTRPISAKNIKLNSHGAPLPKWDTGALTESLGYLYFHGEMAHMILDVEVVN